MEWLDISESGMIFMGIAAGIAVIGMFLFMGKNME